MLPLRAPHRCRIRSTVLILATTVVWLTPACEDDVRPEPGPDVRVLAIEEIRPDCSWDRMFASSEGRFVIDLSLADTADVQLRFQNAHIPQIPSDPRDPEAFEGLRVPPDEDRWFLRVEGIRSVWRDAETGEVIAALVSAEGLSTARPEWEGSIRSNLLEPSIVEALDAHVEIGRTAFSVELSPVATFPNQPTSEVSVNSMVVHVDVCRDCLIDFPAGVDCRDRTDVRFHGEEICQLQEDATPIDCRFFCGSWVASRTEFCQ